MKTNNIKISSNRSFGIVFFIFFLIVAIFPLLNDENIRIWSLIVCTIFLISGLLNLRFLTPLKNFGLNLEFSWGILFHQLLWVLFFFQS